MSDNIQVALRVRPLIGKEILERDALCVAADPARREVTIGDDRTFTFDHVFPPAATQVNVFDACVRPLLDSFVTGLNCTILAYGQTASGKTFTIQNYGGRCSDEELGVLPRAAQALFDHIAGSDSRVIFAVRVVFLEIYGDELRDLLNVDSARRLDIRETESGISVTGASERPCASPADMLAALEEGSLARATASTMMNAHSSRSHAVFTIILEQRIPAAVTAAAAGAATGGAAAGGDGATNGAAAAPGTDDAGAPAAASAAAGGAPATSMVETRISKFHILDLAGSERAKRTQATGKRMQEGININLGLLALGNVISALSDEEKRRKGAHVPYRDSKLTRILQDSLGGNSKTTMIACVSPAEANLEESLNTLRYASRARNIKNKPVINRDAHANQIAQLQAEIEALRQQLLGGGGSAAGAASAGGALAASISGGFLDAGSALTLRALLDATGSAALHEVPERLGALRLAADECTSLRERIAMCEEEILRLTAELKKARQAADAEAEARLRAELRCMLLEDTIADGPAGGSASGSGAGGGTDAVEAAVAAAERVEATAGQAAAIAAATGGVADYDEKPVKLATAAERLLRRITDLERQLKGAKDAAAAAAAAASHGAAAAMAQSGRAGSVTSASSASPWGLSTLSPGVLAGGGVKGGSPAPRTPARGTAAAAAAAIASGGGLPVRAAITAPSPVEATAAELASMLADVDKALLVGLEEEEEEDEDGAEHDDDDADADAEVHGDDDDDDHGIDVSADGAETGGSGAGSARRRGGRSRLHRRQANMLSNISALEVGAAAKQRLMEVLLAKNAELERVKATYDARLRDMHRSIQDMSAERDRLQRELAKVEHLAEEEREKATAELNAKLRATNEKLREFQQRMRNTAELDRIKARTDAEIGRLKAEIDSMKRARMAQIMVLRLEKQRVAEKLAQRDRDVIKLSKEGAELRVELARVKAEGAKREGAYKRRLEEVTTAAATSKRPGTSAGVLDGSGGKASPMVTNRATTAAVASPPGKNGTVAGGRVSTAAGGASGRVRGGPTTARQNPAIEAIARTVRAARHRDGDDFRVGRRSSHAAGGGSRGVGRGGSSDEHDGDDREDDAADWTTGDASALALAGAPAPPAADSSTPGRSGAGPLSSPGRHTASRAGRSSLGGGAGVTSGDVRGSSPLGSSSARRSSTAAATASMPAVGRGGTGGGGISTLTLRRELEAAVARVADRERRVEELEKRLHAREQDVHMLEDLIDQRDALLQNAAARSARSVATGADSLFAGSRDAGADMPQGPLPASMQAAGTGFDPTLVDDINAFFDAQYGPSIDAAAHGGGDEQSPRAQPPASASSAVAGVDSGPARSFGSASTSTASSLRDLLITPRAAPSKSGAAGDTSGRFFAPDGDAAASAAGAADSQHDRRRSLTDEEADALRELEEAIEGAQARLEYTDARIIGLARGDADLAREIEQQANDAVVAAVASASSHSGDAETSVDGSLVSTPAGAASAPAVPPLLADVSNLSQARVALKVLFNMVVGLKRDERHKADDAARLSVQLQEFRDASLAQEDAARALRLDYERRLAEQRREQAAEMDTLLRLAAASTGSSDASGGTGTTTPAAGTSATPASADGSSVPAAGPARGTSSAVAGCAGVVPTSPTASGVLGVASPVELLTMLQQQREQYTDLKSRCELQQEALHALESERDSLREEVNRLATVSLKKQEQVHKREARRHGQAPGTGAASDAHAASKPAGTTGGATTVIRVPVAPSQPPPPPPVLPSAAAVASAAMAAAVPTSAAPGAAVLVGGASMRRHGHHPAGPSSSAHPSSAHGHHPHRSSGAHSAGAHGGRAQLSAPLVAQHHPAFHSGSSGSAGSDLTVRGTNIVAAAVAAAAAASAGRPGTAPAAAAVPTATIVLHGSDSEDDEMDEATPLDSRAAGDAASRRAPASSSISSKTTAEAFTTASDEAFSFGDVRGPAGHHRLQPSSSPPASGNAGTSGGGGGDDAAAGAPVEEETRDQARAWWSERGVKPVPGRTNSMPALPLSSMAGAAAAAAAAAAGGPTAASGGAPSAASGPSSARSTSSVASTVGVVSGAPASTATSAAAAGVATGKPLPRGGSKPNVLATATGAAASAGLFVDARRGSATSGGPSGAAASGSSSGGGGGGGGGLVLKGSGLPVAATIMSDLSAAAAALGIASGVPSVTASDLGTGGSAAPPPPPPPAAGHWQRKSVSGRYLASAAAIAATVGSSAATSATASAASSAASSSAPTAAPPSAGALSPEPLQVRASMKEIMSPGTAAKAAAAAAEKGAAGGADAAAP